MKKIFFVFLCFFIFATQVNCAPKKINDKTAKQWFDSGLYNMHVEQYGKAINDFSKAITIDNAEDIFYYHRGLAYLINMQFTLAYQDFSQATLLEPENVRYLEAKATTDLFIKNRATADIIADYDKAISLSANDYSLYNNRGKAYATIQEYDKAIADYTMAIKANPASFQAYTNRAESYIYLHQYDLAKKDLDSALAISPKDAVAYYTLGLLYKELKQFDLAIENFNKALYIDAKYPDPYYAKAQIYGQYTEAGQRLLAINNYQLFIEAARKNTNLDYCINNYTEQILIAEQKIPELHK